jgi:PAS domain S-box-containing protein
MILEVSTEEKLIAQLFGNQPDSVVWFTPVFSDADSKLVVDFEIRYCNATASKILSAEPSRIIGSSLLGSNLMDKASISLIYDQSLKVWQSGEAIEFTYYSPGFDKYFNVQRSKVNNGILSITRDRTAEVKAEKIRETQTVLLHKVVNNSPTCIVLCQAKRDQKGKIVDFALLMVNDKIANDLNRSKEEIQSMTYCSLHPAVRENGLIDVLSTVVETGERFNGEIYLEVFGGWFLLTVDRVDEDKILATYLDINIPKTATQKIEEQAKWYNDILNYSSNAAIVVSAVRNDTGELHDLRLLLANETGKKILGISDGDLGKSISEFFEQRVKQGHFESHKKVIESGQEHSETIAFEVNGEKKWFQLSLSKLGDGVISNFTDITEIKEKEKTIQEQAKLLDLMLNSSLNAVYTLTARRNNEGAIVDFIISHANAIFCQMSRKTREDLEGKSFFTVFPDTRSTGIFERNCKVLNDGIQIRQQYRYTGDGVDRWYDNAINKVSENQIVIAFNDITPLKEVALELENTVRKLEDSNERLTDFTQVASHDLNAPLRKILMYINFIRDRFGNALDTELQEYVDKIDKTANRMQLLINNLLAYAHVTNQVSEFKALSLSDIVQDVQNDLESPINESQAKIVVSPLPFIQGDKTQLTQVFQNLISNAIKFRKQSDVPFIQIKRENHKLKDGKEYECISLKDNGIGFEQNQSDEIFQVFHRLHSYEKYEGTGLGLAIVRKAMENHHGYVEVQSKVGLGSTFYLLFPMNEQ